MSYSIESDRDPQVPLRVFWTDLPEHGVSVSSIDLQARPFGDRVEQLWQVVEAMLGITERYEVAVMLEGVDGPIIPIGRTDDLAELERLHRGAVEATLAGHRWSASDDVETPLHHLLREVIAVVSKEKV